MYLSNKDIERIINQVGKNDLEKSLEIINSCDYLSKIFYPKEYLRKKKIDRFLNDSRNNTDKQ